MSNDLIARLEAATGPDRELDAAIKKLVGHDWDYAADWGPRGFEEPVAHPYTASIDAALTLVPEGWTFCLETHLDGRASVNMWNPQGYISLGEHGGFEPIDAPAPALAICIAALKAKENSNGS